MKKSAVCLIRMYMVDITRRLLCRIDITTLFTKIYTGLLSIYSEYCFHKI